MTALAPRSRRPSRPRRRRTENVRPLQSLIGGLAVLLLLVGVILLGIEAPNGLPGLAYRTLYARLVDAGNLQQHDEVEIAGVRVGQVISVSPDGDRSRVDLKLDPGVGRLAVDTTVAVRANGLLGGRYVQLTPGTSPRTLSDGATIQGGPSALTFGVPDALDTFDAQTRGALGQMLRGLGQGFLGNGSALNNALGVGSADGLRAQRISSAVLAVPGAAQRLVPALDGAVGALEVAKQDLAGLFAPTATALAPFVDQRAAVQQALARAPGTLAAAQPALDQGSQLLAAAGALARAAHATLPAAPAGLTALNELLIDSPTPLKRADALLVAAAPAVPSALHITGGLKPLLPPLGHALTNTDPVLHALTKYGCDVIDTAKNWHSALGYGVYSGLPFGPLDNFRVTAVGGPGSIQGLGSGLGPSSIQFKPVDYPAPCIGIGGIYNSNLVP